jgi:multidrug efflux pump
MKLMAVRAGTFAAGTLVGWFLKKPVNAALGVFLRGFNKVFDALSNGYGAIVRGFLRVTPLILLIYVGCLYATVEGFKIVPKGFIPIQDKGYLVMNAQLPDGASLARTDKVVRELADQARAVPGVAHTIELPGYSTLLSTNLSNAGGMFIVLAPFEERKLDPELGADAILRKLRMKFAAHEEALVGVFGAPPVDGLGSTGGFKIQVQDLRGAGLRALEGSLAAFADAARRDPRIATIFSTFTAAQPQLFIDIDREKARSAGISIGDISQTLQGYLGSIYVNDFTFLNRNWQVNVQADPAFRVRVEDIGRLMLRNSRGQLVPLATLIDVRNMAGPAIVNHYNLYPSAELSGMPAPGVSSGQAIAAMDGLAQESLPAGMGTEWTELALQEVLAGKDLLSKLIFPLAVIFVFMVLAAQYESWSLPFAILLIVPMCVLAALGGLFIAHRDNNIFAQIGLVVLIGLAAKNAILVVEFSKQLQDAGKGRREAVVEASRTRLRPILMTAFAFILGVVPLVLAKGAGWEMRTSLGIAVFSGMLGVTAFGLIFTPVFYDVIRGFIDRAEAKEKAKKAAEGHGKAEGAAHGGEAKETPKHG